MRFLGYVVDADGVSVDQDKLKVIANLDLEDLMDSDNCMPSQQKARPFLGMALFYQHLIPA